MRILSQLLLIYLAFFHFIQSLYSGVTQITNSSSLTGITWYQYSIISQNGQIGYVSVLQGFTYVINIYNLTTPTMTLIGTFNNNNYTINPIKLCLTDQYIISYSSSDLTFHYFSLANRTIIGSFTVGQLINSFTFLPNKKLILYISTFTGHIRSFSSNFTNPITFTTITAGLSLLPSVYFSVSPNQNYIAVCQNSLKIRIISLNNNTILWSYTLFLLGDKVMTWHPNQTLFFFVIKGQTSFYTVNITNNFLVSAPKTISRNFLFEFAWNIIQMYYLSGSDQILVVHSNGGLLINTNIFSYNWQTGTVNYQLDMNYPQNQQGINFQQQSDIYFTSFSLFRVQFWKIQGVADANAIPVVVNTTTNIVINNTVSNISIVNTTTTANQSSNTTSPTNLTNTTTIDNNNQTIINNNIYSEPASIYMSEQTFQNYQQILSTIMENQGLQSLNSVPGGRTIIKPIFAFFVNFDDFWLYCYHPRQYDRVINTFFAMNQALQSQKWSLVPFPKLWSLVGVNTTSFKQTLNNKYNYTSAKFIQVQGNSNGFYINSLNFFFSNVFFILLVYLSFRLIFFLTYNYRISILFRSFSFWPCCVIMCLQGNVQYLSYLYQFEIEHLFNINFHQKITTIFVIITFFMIFIFCSGIYFLLKLFYGNLSKYLMDNTNMNLLGIVYFSFISGYKNIFIGFSHGIFDDNYIIKLSTLLGLQLLAMGISMYVLSKKYCLYIKSKIWINQITSLLRICLIVTFFIDHNFTTFVHSLFEYPHLIIIYSIMGMFVIGIFVESISRLIETKQLLFNPQRIKDILQKYQKSHFPLNKSKFHIEVFTKKQNMNEIVKNQNILKMKKYQIQQFEQYNKIKIKVNNEDVKQKQEYKKQKIYEFRPKLIGKIKTQLKNKKNPIQNNNQLVQDNKIQIKTRLVKQSSQIYNNRQKRIKFRNNIVKQLKFIY